MSMTKYSDDSNIEKTAGATTSSRDPMKPCCAELVKTASTGEHVCPCGNQLAVIRH
jgi:hypothetical protein